MATDTFRRVHKLDDLTVFKLFERVKAAIGEENVNTTFKVAGLGFNPDQIDEDDLTGRYAFQSASLSWSPEQQKSLSINFTRDIKEAGGNGRHPSAEYDDIQLSLAQNAAAFQDQSELISQVMKLIGEVDIAPAIGGVAPNAEILREMSRSFASSQQQLLSKLTEAVTNAEETRNRIAGELQEKEEHRQREHEEKVAALEKERKRLEQESHKATRRNLLKRMTEKSVRDRVREGQSAQAWVARWLVVVLAISVAVLAGYSAVLSLGAVGTYFEAYQLEAEPDSTSHWSFALILTSRLVISSFVAIGALFYAANWLKVIYRSDEAAGREVDRFTYDLLRASWATEAYLETTREYQAEFPEELMDGLTRGLFGANNVKEQLSEEEQALGSLLGMSASAKVGSDGVEVVLNKKGLRRLANAVEQDQKN